MSPSHTLDVLELLASFYPGFEITDRTIAGYALVWADQDFEAMCQAALQYARTGERFFPSPGQLIELVREARDSAPLAEVAWSEVRRAIHDVGHLRDPKWSHPRVGAAQTAALGGWAVFCRTALHAEMPSHRARFIAAYQSIGEAERAEAERSSAGALLDQTGSGRLLQLPAMPGGEGARRASS